MFSPSDYDNCEQWKCRECGEWAPAPEWKESEVGCEDCGSHPAAECPNCGDRWDMIFGTPESRVPLAEG